MEKRGKLVLLSAVILAVAFIAIHEPEITGFLVRNQVPVYDGSVFSASTDEPLLVNLEEHFYDAEGAPLSYELETTDFAVLDGGMLVFTADEPGEYSVNLLVSDGANNVYKPISFVVDGELETDSSVQKSNEESVIIESESIANNSETITEEPEHRTTADRGVSATCNSCSSCTTCLSSAQTCVLTQNISSSGGCIVIDADNAVLDCAGFTVTYGTGTSDNNVGVASSNDDGVIVKNCVISDGNSAGQYGRSIGFLGGTNVDILNNTISNQGTNQDVGIFLTNCIGLDILDNVISTSGSGGSNYGIYLTYVGSPCSAVVDGNNISTYGSSNNDGIRVDCNSNTIVGNSVIANGTGINNYGVHSLNNVGNIFRNNVVFASSPSSGGHACVVNNQDSDDFINNTCRSFGPSALSLYVVSSSNNNFFANNTLLSESGWFVTDGSSLNTDFENLSFNSSFGSVNFPGSFQIDGASSVAPSNFNISNNSVFLNSSSVGFLNRSAQITLNGLSFIEPFVKVDFEDDNTFELCSQPQCSNFLFNASGDDEYSFNVSSFTSYEISDSVCDSCSSCSDCMSIEGASCRLNQNISSTGTCIIVGADDVSLNCDGYTVGFDSAGNGGVSGILASSRSNVSVNNCIVAGASSSGNYSLGINLTGVTGANFSNNSVSTDGDSFNFGFNLFSVNNSFFVDNVVSASGSADGSSGRNYGFYLDECFYNVFSDNFVSANGTIGNNNGFRIGGSSSVFSTGNNFTGNVILTDGGEGENIGFFMGYSLDNRFSGNNVTTNDPFVSLTSAGFLLSIFSRNNSFVDNVVYSEGNAFQLDNYEISGNVFLDNFASAVHGKYGVYITQFASAQKGVFNNSFSSNVINGSNWIFSGTKGSENNFTNTTFRNSNGSINIGGFFQLNGSYDVTKSKLDITNNSAFLNSSNLTFLNQSAQITLNNIVFTNPEPEVDFEDDGSFVACNSPQCTEVSFNASGNNEYIFNVSSFTTYRTADSDICGDVSSDLILGNNVSSPGTCFNITADDVVLDCAGHTIEFDSAGNGGVSGVIASNRDNVTVKNCIIRDINASGANGWGINFSGTNNSNVSNNTVQTNGTSNNYGIYLQSSSDNNSVLNNSVFAVGNLGTNVGILVGDSVFNVVEGNVVNTGGTSSNVGVYLLGSDNNGVLNNSVFAGGTSSSNYGVRVFNSVFNVVEGNVVHTNGTSTDIGVDLSSSDNNSVLNNSVFAGGSSGNNFGVRVGNSVFNVVEGNVVSTDGTSSNFGVYLLSSSHNNSFTSNIIRTLGSSSYGIRVEGSENNSFFNSTLNDTVQWLFSDSFSNQNNFTGTAFQTFDGSINSSFFQINGSQDVTKSKLDITNNSAFLDSTNLTFLNQSARITLNNIGEASPQPLVDFDDDGVFEPCVDVCSVVNFIGNTFVYDVSHFTTFSSTVGGINLTVTKSDSPDPVNLTNSTLLNYTILVNVSDGVAFNVTVNETYPDNVSFVSASPAPDSGNNVWFAGNLTAPVTYEINITVNVSSSVSNGTVINNTVNVTFANSTGSGLFVNVTENTTVLNDVGLPCPLDVSTDYVLTENLSCPATAVNILADNIVFECNGGIIEYGSAGNANSYGVNVSSRDNVTVRNCIIEDGNLGGSNSYGIYLTGTSNSFVLNNSVQTNGTTANYAIYLTGSSLSNNVSDNDIYSNASSTSGIRLTSSSDDNIISGNNVTSNGSSTNPGIEIYTSSNTLFDNIVRTVGVGSNNAGIRLGGNSNIVYNNTVFSNGAGNNYGLFITGFSFNKVFDNVVYSDGSGFANDGIRLQSGANNNSVFNNDVFPQCGGSCLGISIDGSDSNNITGNNIITQGISNDNGVELRSGSQNNNITNNVIRVISGDGFALFTNNAQNNFFANNTLNNTAEWIFSLNAADVNNFTNNTFLTPDGSIRPFSFVISGVNELTQTELDVSSNIAFANSSQFAFLNTSSRITLNSIGFSNPQPLVDFQDDGSFIACDPPQCNEVSFSANTFIFDVQSFTTYSSNETIQNVTLLKLDAPDPVVKGQQLNYTITISNTGTATIFNATLNDTLPAGLVFDSSQPVADIGNTFFNLGNITSGQTVSVNITANVSAALSNGTILNNTANLSFTNASFQEVSVVASSLTTVLGYPELSTFKLDYPDPVPKGTQLNYSINVTNFGDDTAFNLTVTENYPAGTVFDSSSPLPSSGDNIFSLGNLSPNASTVLNITVNVSSALSNGTILNNSYDVTFANLSGENLTVSNNTLTAVLGSPVIVAIKSDSPDPVLKGSQLTYFIEVNNTGDDSAFNVSLVEFYPVGVVFDSSSPLPSSGNDTFSIGDLAPNSSVTVNITVNVSSALMNGTVLTNNVNVTFANSSGQNDTVFDSESTIVRGERNMTVSKSDSVDPVPKGSQLSYQINISNVGDDSAFNVSLVEFYPVGVVFDSAQPVPAIGNNIFNLPDLAPIESFLLNITVNVSSGLSNGTVLNNSVVVNGTNFFGIVQQVNVSETTSVLGSPVIVAIKSDSPDPVAKGGQLNYSIVVNNTGDDTAFNVSLVEFYPAGTIFDSSSPVPSSGNDTFNIGNLAPNASYVINITMNVSLGVLSGTVLNNSVNVTFANSSGDNLTVSDFELTTVVQPCPFGVSSSLVLTEGFTCPGTAVNILADDVTFDCNGNTIEFDSVGNGGVSGVIAASRNNVTIRNCIIRDTNASGNNGWGINLSSTDNSNISNNTIYTNATGNGFGIYLLNTENNTVMNNSIQTMGNLSGNQGIYLRTSVHCRIFDNYIVTQGTTNNHGINLFGSANNNSIYNNTIFTNGSSSNNLGIRVFDSDSDNITDNEVHTYGTTTNYGIGLNYADGCRILSNTVFSNGSSNYNYGIFVSNSDFNSVTENNVSTDGDSQNFGIYLFDSAENNNVSGNVVYTNGSSAQNYGLFISTNSFFNTIDKNVLHTDGIGTDFGVALTNLANNNTFSNNEVLTNGVNNNNGIYITNSIFNNFTRNNISTRGSSNNPGIFLTSGGHNNSFEFMRIRTSGSGSYGVRFIGSLDNSFTNAVLNDTAEWISSNAASNGNNFTNTTFQTNNGSINIPGLFQVNGSQDVTKSKLNISNNSAFLNSNSLPFLNTSARITLKGITFSNPLPIVDFQDDGSFASCDSPQCTEISFAGNVFVFDVQSFTTYSTNETIQNVSLLKVDSPDPVVKGQQLNYTITISNTGTAAIYNATLNDTLPGGVAFDSSTPSADIGNTFFNLGNITAGQSVSINITVNVSSALANGTILNNTANLSFTNTSFQDVSLAVSQLTTVLGYPEIATFKTGFPDPVPRGSQLSYQVNVTNVGDDTAFNVNVTETYPANVTFHSSSPSPVIGNNVFSVGTLSPDESFAINITVNVSNFAPNGSILNNSYDVAFENSTGESAVVSNSTLTTVTGVPVVVAVKSDSPDPVVRGQQLLYTILVNNTGDEVARNVTVNESYPAGVTFDSSQPAPSIGNNVFELGNFAPDEALLINITVNVSSALASGTVLNNTINASYVNITNATVLLSTSELTTVIGIPNVSVNKSAPAAANTTSNFNYSIAVQNNGDYQAVSTVVTETYPSGVNFVSSQPSPSAGNNVFNLGSIAAGETFVINITVSASTPGLKNNTISLSYTNSTGLPVLLSAFAETNVSGAPVVTRPGFTGGLGGRIGGGGGGSSYVAREIYMTDDSMITPPLRRLDKVIFEVMNAEHSLTVMRMSMDSVTIVVESEPQVFTLLQGQSIVIDANVDGSPDLRVKVVNLQPPTVVLELIKVRQPAVQPVVIETGEGEVIDIEQDVAEPVVSKVEPVPAAPISSKGVAGRAAWYDVAAERYALVWNNLVDSLKSVLSNDYTQYGGMALIIVIVLVFAGRKIGKKAKRTRTKRKLDKAASLDSNIAKMEKEIEKINKIIKEYDGKRGKK